MYKRQIYTRIPQVEESRSMTATLSEGTPTTNTERRNRIRMSSADPTSNPIWGLCNNQELKFFNIMTEKTLHTARHPYAAHEQ